MKIKPLYLILGVLVALLGWGGYIAWCAHLNLVTLNVRNMEVREVTKKIERQTWETILVHKDVQGKITLNVHRVPLHEVLNIIAEQTSGRWTAMYPLFRQSKSLGNFEKSVVGLIEPETHGWTNLQSGGGFGGRGGRGGGFGGPGGGMGGPGMNMFAEMMRGQNELVSLNVTAKDLDVTTMALARFAQAQIVPEDGVSGTVSLTLHQVPFDKAVKALAKRLNTKWDKYYSLRGGFGGRGGPPDIFAGGGGGRRGFRGPPVDDSGGDGMIGAMDLALVSTNAVQTNEVAVSTNAPTTNLWAQMREERRQKMDEVQQVVMDSLTPEQRKKVDDMRNNPDATRAEFQARMQQRGRDMVKNTTPDQRVQRDAMRIQRQQQMQARQQQQPPPGR